MTPPDEPFDQDDPTRKGRPSGRASGRSSEGRSSPRSSSAPARDDWDDGKGGRPPRSGSKKSNSRPNGNAKRSARSSGGRTAGDGAKGMIEGLPRWAVPAIGIVIVALILFTLVRGCGSSESSNAGTCLTDLAVHLPADSTAVWGTDLLQARKAGYDEAGSLEEVGASLDATGAIPDPVSARYRFTQLTTLEQFEARTGISPGDATCALSTLNRSILSGSFDPVTVKGSQAGSNGDLAATDDLLAMGTGSADPKAMVEPVKNGGLADDVAMIAVLERLRDDGAYSVILQQGSGGSRALAAGIGVGGNKDQRTVPVTWVFKNESAATAGRADVVERVNTVLRGTLSIDSTDLEVDGSMVTAVIPTVEAPSLNDLVNGEITLADPPK